MNFRMDPDRTNAAIDRVAVYKTLLESNSIGKEILNMAESVYHAFVYLQVKDSYFSLDKHTDALTIQISKEKRDVLDNFKGKPRNGVPEELNADKGKINIRNLSDFIIQKKFIN